MFRRKRTTGDFGAEIEAHIELETERLREQGLAYDEARIAARRAFGNVTRARERFDEFGSYTPQGGRSPTASTAFCSAQSPGCAGAS